VVASSRTSPSGISESSRMGEKCGDQDTERNGDSESIGCSHGGLVPLTSCTVQSQIVLFRLKALNDYRPCVHPMNMAPSRLTQHKGQRIEGLCGKEDIVCVFQRLRDFDFLVSKRSVATRECGHISGLLRDDRHTDICQIFLMSSKYIFLFTLARFSIATTHYELAGATSVANNTSRALSKVTS